MSFTSLNSSAGMGSLTYRDFPPFRNDPIDSFSMVFIRQTLYDNLIGDFGSAIVGARFDIQKGEYQAFSVSLSKISDTYVPICQLLCVATFTLKVELYCRKIYTAFVLDRSILLSVWALDTSISCYAYLDAKYAGRKLRKEKLAARLSRSCVKGI